MAILFNLSSLLALIFLVISSKALSATSPSNNASFANTTSLPSGTITASSEITPSLSINTSCSSCVIAVDVQGLQQVVWLTETWSATLDTEYVTVTSFNGSNATAISNTTTVLGDAASLNASANPYSAFIRSAYDQNNGYMNTNATFVRGTNGSVGTTSFPYGQAFAEVTAVEYRYMIPNPSCPMNMGPAGTGCECWMNTWFPPSLPWADDVVSTTTYSLDRTYYQPLSPFQINESLIVPQDVDFPLAPWDGEDFSAWLAEDEGFKSAVPNWEDCAYWNTAGGPPGVKIPVAALTTIISTTVHSAAPITWSSTARPAAQPATPTAKTTVPPIAGQTGSGGEGGSSGSENGGSGGSASSGSSDPESSGSQDSYGSRTSGTTGSSASGGDSGSHGNIGGGNFGTTRSSGLGDGDESTGNSGSTAILMSTSITASQSSDKSSEQSGNAGSTPSDSSAGSQNGGSSENSSNQGSTGSSGSSGSQEGSESSEDMGITSNTGSIGGTESTSSPKSSGHPGETINTGSGSRSDTETQGGESSAGGNSGGNGESGTQAGSSVSAGSGTSGPDSINPIIPFVVSADEHTVSGTVLGSSAVAVAGITIAAGDIPTSAGGVLISVHPGAFSIAINGDSQPLPTARPVYEPAPIATIGGQIITASPGASEVYYAGTTLSQDGPHVTISNKDIYVGSSGLVIGSSTIALPSAIKQESGSEDQPSALTFTAAGYTFTSSPSGIAFAGTSLLSGGAAIISGTTISYGTNGLIVGTSIISVPTPRPAAHSGAEPIQTFTLGGQVFTANPTAVDIAGKTLTLGSPALTIWGTAVSLGSSGIVIASSTYPIPLDAFPSSTTVIDGETFTINPTAIEVGGTTLSKGGNAITINGTVISLGDSGLVVGGSTVSYYNSPSTTAGTTSEGLGAIILAGFGPTSTSTNIIVPTGAGSLNGTSTLAAFQGKAAWLGRGREEFLGLGSLLLAGWIICYHTW